MVSCMCAPQVCWWVSAAIRPLFQRREDAAWAPRPRPPTQTPTCPSEASDVWRRSRMISDGSGCQRPRNEDELSFDRLPSWLSFCFFSQVSWLTNICTLVLKFPSDVWSVSVHTKNTDRQSITGLEDIVSLNETIVQPTEVRGPHPSSTHPLAFELRRTAAQILENSVNTSEG